MPAYKSEIVIAKPEYLGREPWTVIRLRPITVFFGKNGSGKSLLLRAWRDQDPHTCHYIVPERSGDMGYAPNLLHQQLEGQARRNEAAPNFVNNYRTQIVARIQGYFARRGGIDFEKRTSHPKELEAYLARLLPDFVIELRAGMDPPYLLKRTATQADVGGIDNLSSGEAQILTVGLDVLTIAAIWEIEARDTRVMLIDEPDAHIHPDLQVRFADFLAAVADRFKLQIAIATHSTTLLAAIGQFSGHEAGVVYVDREKTTLAVQPFDKYRRELAAFLGGHALMGPLFGVPILLVEGDDDFRIWSQVPRHHQVSFAVIPCNGGELDYYQKALEQLLQSLREQSDTPAGFALIDNDRTLPDAENPSKPQKHIRYVQLQCHEIENLYLSDEVLALLGTDWPTAAALVQAKAVEYGEKRDRLVTVANADRRTADLKGLMDQLADILDEKKVHWTIRVARAIGDKRPDGHLATFLGNDLISALWGSALEPRSEHAEAVGAA